MLVRDNVSLTLFLKFLHLLCVPHYNHPNRWNYRSEINMT